MQVLIAGGSGAIGRALTRFQEDKGNTVRILSRTAKEEIYRWDPAKGQLHPDALESADLIVNLSGAPVAGKRWSPDYKQEMIDSRVQATRLLADNLAQCSPRQRHFINASAVGYYPNSDDLLEEEAPIGEGFLAELCGQWEEEAEKVRSENTRLSILRIGIVLQKGEGFLGQLVPLARLGLAAAVGSGRQHCSWIHIQDLCGIVHHLHKEELEGTFNAVAPEVVTNKTMTRNLAEALKRPYFLPNVPEFVLRLLYGGVTEELVSNHRISCNKIQTKGYQFRYDALKPALKDLLNG